MLFRSIVPCPSYAIARADSFSINEKTTICYNRLAAPSAEYLHNYLKDFLLINTTMIEAGPGNSRIPNDNVIVLDAYMQDRIEKGYRLIADPRRISISGSEEGVFYGIQSLIQMLPEHAGSAKIAGISIYDSPRFDYRGLHLDCCRHFFPVSFVKK